METNLIAEALTFMVLGMGIVVLFLTIMVYVLRLQAKLIGKYFPDKKAETTKAKVTAANNTTKIAAIVAAVQHHKNQKG